MNFWGGILDFLEEVISLIPKIMYYLSVAAMGLLDIAQLLLRKVAGLDAHYVGESTEPVTGDIALSFIRGIFERNSQFPALKNAFWSLVILGVILLVVTTIIAVIRQEYMPGDDESKERPSNNKFFVISRSVKSLFLFLIVPVSVIFGLMISDVFLVAIDSATQGAEVGGTLLADTSITENQLIGTEVNGKVTYKYYDVFGFGDIPTTSITFSGMVFKSGAYVANRVRINSNYAVGDTQKAYYELLVDNDITNFDIFNQVENSYDAAQLIDDAFAANVKLKNPEPLKRDGVATNFNSAFIFFHYGNVYQLSKFNVSLVWYFYDLWQFNFIVAFAILIVLIKLLAKIVMGLMRRIIELVALFMISPPVVAIMPLDGGKAFGEWRKSFISKALSAYGAIVGMNLFFLILPYLNEIKLFSAEGLNWGEVGVGGATVWNASNAIGMINLIVSTLFIVSGVVLIESFIELISGFLSSESVAKTGGEMVGKVGDTIAKSASLTGAVAGGAAKFTTALPRLALKATGVDKKIAGGIGNLTRAGRRAIAYGGRNSKRGIKTKNEIAKKWLEGGGQKAYNEMLSGNQGYNDEMNEAFKQRKTGKNMSYDDWKDTKEGQNASQSAIDSVNAKATDPANKIQDFNSFMAGTTRNKKGRFVESDAYKAFSQSAMNEQVKSFPEAFTARRAAIQDADDISRFAKGLDRFGGQLVKEAGGLNKHFSSYLSNFKPLIEQATERQNKQGLKSMVMAFQGKTAKDIEMAELYTKLRDEEAAKAQVNEEERAKAAKKQEAADRQKSDAQNKVLAEHTKQIEELKKKQK